MVEGEGEGKRRERRGEVAALTAPERDCRPEGVLRFVVGEERERKPLVPTNSVELVREVIWKFVPPGAISAAKELVPLLKPLYKVLVTMGTGRSRRTWFAEGQAPRSLPEWTPGLLAVLTVVVWMELDFNTQFVRLGFEDVETQVKPLQGPDAEPRL